LSDILQVIVISSFQIMFLLISTTKAVDRASFKMIVLRFSYVIRTT